MFSFNVQVEVVRQERLNTSIEHQCILHHTARIYVVNMHASHNAALIRKVFPRALVQPIPLYEGESRRQLHLSCADRFHQAQGAKREAASKKRKDAKAAKEAETSNGTPAL